MHSFSALLHATFILGALAAPAIKVHDETTFESRRCPAYGNSCMGVPCCPGLECVQVTVSPQLKVCMYPAAALDAKIEIVVIEAPIVKALLVEAAILQTPVVQEVGIHVSVKPACAPENTLCSVGSCCDGRECLLIGRGQAYCVGRPRNANIVPLATESAIKAAIVEAPIAQVSVNKATLKAITCIPEKKMCNMWLPCCPRLECLGGYCVGKDGKAAMGPNNAQTLVINTPIFEAPVVEKLALQESPDEAPLL